MSLKIDQTVSKNPQARALLKELLKVHQIHQASTVRELTDADELILQASFNKTRELMPKIKQDKLPFTKKWASLFNFLMAEEIAFARVLTDNADNLNAYEQARNQAQQAYRLAETAINNLNQGK